MFKDAAMETMDKNAAMHYIVSNNPVCTDCARGNLQHLRMAAGLYQVLKEIVSDEKEIYTFEDLNELVLRATRY